MNNVLPIAQEQLEKNGAFYPFSAVVGDDGSVRLRSAHDAAETPRSQQLLHQLYDGTRLERASILAVAFVADVRLPSTPKDAIRVELEHREGHLHRRSASLPKTRAWQPC